MEGKVFSTFQAAKICRVAPVTIIRWIEAGKLQSYKTPGGHRRIREADLLSFMDDHGLPRFAQDGISKPRVLIIDDEMLVRKYIQQSLDDSDLDCLCETCNDGIDTLMKIGLFQPDIMILDINIPWVDGLEICRRIRANETTRHMRIIVVTGFLSNNDKDEITSAGADYLLFKPFDSEQLLEAVSSALNTAT